MVKLCTVWIYATEARWGVYEKCGASRSGCHADMSARYGISDPRWNETYLLLQGLRRTPTYLNRACTRRPKARATRHDKLSLTPLEAQEAGALPFCEYD